MQKKNSFLLNSRIQERNEWWIWKFSNNLLRLRIQICISVISINMFYWSKLRKALILDNFHYCFITSHFIGPNWTFNGNMLQVFIYINMLYSKIQIATFCPSWCSKRTLTDKPKMLHYRVQVLLRGTLSYYEIEIKTILSRWVVCWRLPVEGHTSK